MADIRQKIINSAAPQLQPGETAITAFAAQTKPWWWLLFGAVLFMALNHYRTVVITDRRILVFDSGKWTTTKAKTLLHEIPRATKIGPASGLWYSTDVLGEPLNIHKRFHKDVAMADGVPV